MFVTPSVIVDGKVVTNDLVDINLQMRILLGSSYYEDWDEHFAAFVPVLVIRTAQQNAHLQIDID